MLDTVTIVGNLTKDPELRPVGTGFVTNLRVATTQRRFDKATGEWFDAASTFFTVSAWRTLGENVVASLRRGDRVVVVGRLRQRTWQPSEGPARMETEIDAEVIGADLAFAKAMPVRVRRNAAVGPDPQGGREAYLGGPDAGSEVDAGLETGIAAGLGSADEPPMEAWESAADPEPVGATA